jgi:predicted transposase YdaD
LLLETQLILDLLKDIMQIVTSWMEQGIAEGEQRGRTEEARSLVTRLLMCRVGTLPSNIEAQVQLLNLQELEALGEALLDFAQLSDLTDWLRSNS